MMLVHSRSEHGGLMECGIEIERDRNLAAEIDGDGQRSAQHLDLHDVSYL